MEDCGTAQKPLGDHDMPLEWELDDGLKNEEMRVP